MNFISCPSVDTLIMLNKWMSGERLVKCSDNGAAGPAAPPATRLHPDARCVTTHWPVAQVAHPAAPPPLELDPSTPVQRILPLDVQ